MLSVTKLLTSETSSFFYLLNGMHTTDSEEYVSSRVSDVLSDGHVPIVISSSDIDECLKNVRLGKAAGIDGLDDELCSHGKNNYKPRSPLFLQFLRLKNVFDETCRQTSAFYNYLTINQFGFKQKHSTNPYINILLNLLLNIIILQQHCLYMLSMRI